MRTFPSETITYTDPLTGAIVRQLTNYKGHSYHPYFTTPGWFDENRRMLFGSDRDGRTNLFSIELASGEITQHTDGDMPAPPFENSYQGVSVHPSRPEAYFVRYANLTALDLETGRERALYTAPDGFLIGGLTSVSADGKRLFVGLTEDLSARIRLDLGRGYVGFEEVWAAKPDCRIVRVDLETGVADTLWQENAWIGHINASPTQPDLLTFCHEGPWPKVDHRIWGMNTATGGVWPICPREDRLSHLGHEYWHADGIHLGFHGYATSGLPVFGSIRYDDAERFEVAFPFETGHVHSNDFNLIVGDAGTVVRLWRWTGTEFEGPRALCEHRCSAHVQILHVHPRFTPDGKRVVFTSDQTGYGQVYEAVVPEWESLPTVPDAK